jgi:hypothetical protein
MLQSVEGGIETAIDDAHAEFFGVILTTYLIDLYTVAQSREVDHL